MFRNATPEKAIAFTQFIVALTYCWPLSSTATKFQVFRFKILRFIAFLNALMLLVPLLYALHVNRGNTEKISKTALQTFAIAHVIVQTLSCSTQYDRFQRLIEEMKFLCQNANSYEREVFQRYVDKYSMFYGMFAIWFYATAVIVISGTLLISDPFPTNAEYPFFVNFEPLRTIIFVHQSFVGFQCAAHVSMNIFCALLLLFAAARFNILMIELRSVKTTTSLMKCIRKYYAIRRYSKEVVYAVRFSVLITVTAGGIASVFSCITFVGRQPFTVKIQFFFMTATALVEVFMCALPSDYLMETSKQVMQVAYESEWHEQPLEMQKYILLTLIPQPPVVLRVKCIIPILSLNYYCSFISNVFSLFTALRIIMNDENDN